MSLEIKKISKKYGNQEALSNISFSLNKGDIVGFLGPNGAGKTTLMKIITSTLHCKVRRTGGSGSVLRIVLCVQRKNVDDFSGASSVLNNIQC